MDKKPLGIYIHIPFCKAKCYYCDFVSFKNIEDKAKEYIECVIKEIENKNWKEINSKYIVTTIYIGGGTPSYIDSSYINDVLKVLKRKIQECSTEQNVSKTKINEVNVKDINTIDTINENVEITIEVNPGTVDEKKLTQYRKIGINRLSIGLQSTNDTLLKQIGRIHTYEQFLNTYKTAQKVGFNNINVDLMLGLPNQTIEDIKQSLENVIKLDPNHISVYSLILEEGTKLYDMVENNKVQLPDEEIERRMYWYVKNKLELSGYKHYEISNFSKPGKESKHNWNCWNQEEYMGFGLAAHSYFEDKRFSNTEDIKEYMENIQNNKIKENIKIHEIQNIDDKKREYMLLGLRKIEGVSISKFKERFIDNPLYLYRNELQKLVSEGLINVDGDNIKLSNKGLDLANLVWEEFV